MHPSLTTDNILDVIFLAFDEPTEVIEPSESASTCQRKKERGRFPSVTETHATRTVSYARGHPTIFVSALLVASGCCPCSACFGCPVSSCGGSFVNSKEAHRLRGEANHWSKEAARIGLARS
jgi:hypothetical protein